jgi:hypothetical protein
VVVKSAYCSGKIKLLSNEPQQKTNPIFDDWKTKRSKSASKKEDYESKEKIKKADLLLEAVPNNEKEWRWSRTKGNKSNGPMLSSKNSNNWI